MKNLWRCLLSIAALLACTLSSAGTITYYHNDIAGSPIAATNESGAVLWRESYRPYGERLTNAPASTPNDVWFTSRRQDVDTGLVYMGARYYDPVIGRFMSTDPVGFDEKNVHTFNRYAYAANNPYKFVDPDGREFKNAITASKEFGEDIVEIRRYLAAAGLDGILQALDKRPEIVTLQPGWPSAMQYDPHSVTITIDTRSGNRVSDGGVQSPALGFLHEAGHALQHLTKPDQYAIDRVEGSDALYGKREERRVIEQIETPAAKRLGEATRNDPIQRHIPVSCATCRN